MRGLTIVILYLFLSGAPAKGQEQCELELVLAVDVSGSVNQDEYRLQMGGLASALRSPEVSRLLARTGLKGVYLTLLQWSGQPHQAQVVPWRKITDEASVLAFADEVDRAPRAFKIYSTAIGEALSVARSLFAGSGVHCRRRVVDVSGDGRSNEGVSVDLIRDALVAEGIAINGIVITGDDKGLKQYFQQNVIGGDGAFVMAVKDFEDYPQAIRRKLLREIAPRITRAPQPDRQFAQESADTRQQGPQLRPQSISLKFQ